MATKRILDNVRNQKFDETIMRSCPNPKIINKYGVHGVCMVSVFTCMHCKQVNRFQWHSGLACGYGKEVKDTKDEEGSARS